MRGVTMDSSCSTGMPAAIRFAVSSVMVPGMTPRAPMLSVIEISFVSSV